MDWRHAARCREVDPETFFPVNPGDEAQAKAVCARCPVRAQCLDFALEEGLDDGIFGGLNAAERRKIRQLTLVTV